MKLTEFPYLFVPLVSCQDLDLIMWVQLFQSGFKFAPISS